MSDQTDSVYRAFRRTLRFLIGLFFRDVQVEGLENLPADRGGLLVAAHPNGLIDPALMMAVFPGRVVFGARHGLFHWPVIGPLIKRLGSVPIYREMDQTALSKAARMEANKRSLDGLSKALADGSYSALFPEGLSPRPAASLRDQVGSCAVVLSCAPACEGRDRQLRPLSRLDSTTIEKMSFDHACWCPFSHR